MDMHNIPPIHSWVDHLRQLIPTTGLLLIGAGSGTGSCIQYLRETACYPVALVEADGIRFQQLQQITALYGNWQLRQNLVAPEAGPANFHRASHSGESGLLQPESLQRLWPNLRTVDQQTLEAITLADLLQDIPFAVNYLFIDCLPAESILGGTGTALDRIDVIVARVLLDESFELDRPLSLTSLRNFLEPRGFRLLTTEVGRHPAYGRALFIRDTQSVISKLRDQWIKENDRTLEIQQLTSLVEDLKNQLAEARIAVDHLRQIEIEAHELRLRTKLQSEELTRAIQQIRFINDLLLHERPS